VDAEATDENHQIPAFGPTTVAADDLALQAHLLEGVSRTFALTIPQLPASLYPVVANGYLLCRIVDTIEDEPALGPARTRELAYQFADVVSGDAPAEVFAQTLAPLLSQSTIPAEHELIRSTPAVIRISHSFSAPQREALETCVRTMARGMVDFQSRQSLDCLPDQHAMDRYCYFVAGVVGEMLTKLFCEYSSVIDRHRDQLMGLSVSFGQGLQMTNILKDIWDDRRRGACWLPREVFADQGYDLRDLAPGGYNEGFGRGMSRLIAVAHSHLRNALDYTLLIPRHEPGIRNFCLWAIGMAELTLRKIHRHLDFQAGSQVKISRRSVRAAVLACRFSVGNDFLLKLLFELAAFGLPSMPGGLGRVETRP